ncbi:SNF2-related, N-terminal domain [Sesbania bispinosa]|nr:SNF2-related, N-terminal domain [Sesbania bispinosa]
MASSHNVELEAAKFLHKLIQDSKDEPAKLATKLYVILQHMKSSGKEHSMPYQVISRAMETVINQHGLDIEALKSSRLPLAGSAQIGSSQAVGITKDSRGALGENEMPKMDHFASGRPPVAPSSGATDYYQGSVAQRSGQSFDQESPSSLDSRSANSQSQDRHDVAKWDKQVNQKDGKKATSKRKRRDASPVEPHVDIPSQLDPRNTVNTRKGKMTKAESSDGLPVKSGELTNYSMVPSSIQMEHFPALSGSMQTMHNANEEGAYGKVHGGMVVATSAQLKAEPVFSSSMQYGGAVEHDSGSSTTLSDGHKIAQIGRQSSFSEMTMLRQGLPPRDKGKSTVPAVPESSAMPFKEQQLKQLRAQCLVFLAFRNNLAPKKLHLEIALGTYFSREGKDLIDHKGKSHSSNELGNSSGLMMPFGGLNNVRQSDNNPSGSSSAGKTLLADSFSKGTESPRMMEDKGILSDERKCLLAAKKGEFEKKIQEKGAAQTSSAISFQQDSSSTRGALVVNNHSDDVDDGNLQVRGSNQPSIIGLNKQVNPEIINRTGFASPNEASKGHVKVSTLKHDLPIERRDNIPSQFQNIVNNGGSRNNSFVNHLTHTLKEHWKPIMVTNIDSQGAMMMQEANLMAKQVSADGFKSVPVDDASRHGISFAMGQEGNESLSNNLPPPKYTMSERWIMDQQKKRLLVKQNWVQKLQKTKQRMVTSFHQLKENVNSSEDISTKTKSVIDLKKLQLLELQRRLRSDFLNEFFKPITTEMEHLKSIKKHRHGRRIKQLEKYEQKMKEERQKRIRERQKEFFSEIEVHKERLDDVFKIKRERWKGFNRYVKEFHKRKERIHREKIDRIQREKINLLKINDVEGYLRIVQDAKSDRVKQLLKETEKYLQKLGSKLQEAKAVAGRFEHDVDEAESGSFLEKSENNLENEDETDQAKHYMESNEKYYMMAHSVKESIAEQPSCLQGGKLREYQMNGLRWLVSLYNNHLNGILADEMGLGKTVQVISLICYLMETKNDRGPFLVVVPSSVLPGWDSEINFWAPGIHKIVYAGPPEERRRLFKERIVHQKFNVLLTTYEYLMNKHDRPKLSKIHWHYVIIDEGHRIKNASCKLNADLKLYQSSHRLLLTGTPLQNNLEELWALLNFLLPNIFNSSEDFSQWFNKPFESSGDNSPDEALLSEEENLLIINRLHQVLRPFVLRRLKHKVENELPEKIERLVRCEASAYQKLLMKRVEENLGSIGTTKARSVHNSVMELRNICNHPYLSHLHVEEVDNFIPKHYLPPIVRLCGKLEMLDRILPKLKDADHRVLFFSTMTRLLDVMEEYLTLKQHRYLRLDGHTSGNDRGALIERFNQPDSPYFIFLLSIRAGGVGVNLQAADTVIIFDTDWNPQAMEFLLLIYKPRQGLIELVKRRMFWFFDLKQLVLFSVTYGLAPMVVQTVEEQVRAAAEHKLGVANQSITAGFFDNNTSAKDRREYLESLLRECKKEEAAPVLDDDALNDLLARSETELDVFEAIDKKRREDEMATWNKLVALDGSEQIPPLPSRLVTDEDLKQFYEVMKISDVPKGDVASNGVKRKSVYLGGLDTQQYGRGKRAREVRSYEEQWTEEEFDKMCQAESPESLKLKEVTETNCPTNASCSAVSASVTDPAAVPPVAPLLSSAGSFPLQKGTLSGHLTSLTPESNTHSSEVTGVSRPVQQPDTGVAPNLNPAIPILTVTTNSQSDATSVSAPIQTRGQGQKTQSGGEATRCRGKKQVVVSPPVPGGPVGPDLKVNEQLKPNSMNLSTDQAVSQSETVSCITPVHHPTTISGSASLSCGKDNLIGVGTALNSLQSLPLSSITSLPQTVPTHPPVSIQNKGQNRKSQNGSGAPQRRGKKQATTSIPDVSAGRDLHLTPNLQFHQTVSHSFGDQDLKSSEGSNDLAKKTVVLSSIQDNTTKSPGPEIEKVQVSDVHDSISDTLSKTTILQNSVNENFSVPTLPVAEVTKDQSLKAKTHQSAEASKVVLSVEPPINSLPGSATIESFSKPIEPTTTKVVPSAPSGIVYPSAQGSESTPSCPSESMPVKRQGRKTQNRVDPPRRRGKKPTLDSSVDSLVGKATTNVSQAQALQILLPSGGGSDMPTTEVACLTPDLVVNIREKQSCEEATNQNLKDKASSVMPTARAMDASNNQCWQDNAGSHVPTTGAECLTSNLIVNRHEKQSEEASNIQKLEGKACSDVPIIGAVDASNIQCEEHKAGSDTPTLSLAVNRHEKKPEDIQTVVGEPSSDMPTTEAADALNNQYLEDKAGSDIPNTGAVCLTSDLAVSRHVKTIRGSIQCPEAGKHEKQSEEASNIQGPVGEASSDVPTTGVGDMPTTGAVNASNIDASVGERVESLSDKDSVLNLPVKLDAKESELQRTKNAECSPEMDVTKSCLPVQETVSVDGGPPPSSSAAVYEHAERLSEKDLVFKSLAKLDAKESEAGMTNQGNPVVQDNTLEDLDQSLLQQQKIKLH